VRTPRDLSDPASQRATGEREMLALVRHGRAGMPALVPAVGDADASSLVAFVRLFSPGHELYATLCSGCHGDDGHGPPEPSAVEQPPRVRFDRAYFAGRDPERLRVDAWHMVARERPAMPHFAEDVTEAEARAIVEWLERGRPPDRP
jgi:mono/diheme cytochrome c family protein